MATSNGVHRNGIGLPPHGLQRPDRFGKVAAWTTRASGGRWGFLTAAGVVVAWAISGPFFRFSNNWQLVINTGTTIVTFLMVFLIQNAQNRESKAVHLKLDELILALRGARNEMIDIEGLTEDQLNQLGRRYTRVAERHQHKLEAAITHKVDEVEEDVEEVSHRVEDVEKKVEDVERKMDYASAGAGAGAK